jgi:hypothetical protein
MSLIAQLLIAASLTAAIGGGTATGTSLHRSLLPEPCPATLTVGHVPGHLEPVWELRCTTPHPEDREVPIAPSEGPAALRRQQRPTSTRSRSDSGPLETASSPVRRWRPSAYSERGSVTSHLSGFGPQAASEQPD